MIGLLVIATIPVVIVGMVVLVNGGNVLRSAVVVGWSTIGFGILLYVADRCTVTINRIEHMTWGRALIIGIAQTLALIPGASRAGTTITMARWLGFERTEAARFSMLMSIPAIMAAGAAATYKLFEEGDQYVLIDAMVASAMSFVTAFFAIIFMMSWLRTSTFTPFVVYRLIIGAAILVWAYH
jgi:undecaprenyl-diphosphatase